MTQDLISKKTRYEFREFLVSWTLREIEMEFDAADIECSDVDPGTSGQRRTLVEQYYHTLDFTKWDDVKKLLKAYEGIITTIVDHSPDDAKRLLRYLERDGFVYVDSRIQPAAATPSSMGLRSVANELDADEISRQISRIEGSVDSDPALALGTAKELIETCCKTILKERGVAVPANVDVPKLVKAALRELKLVPENIPSSAKGARTIKRILSNLATVPQGLAELRNLYGSGHGRDGKAKGILPRHARLAAGAAITLSQFLFDTHNDR